MNSPVQYRTDLIPPRHQNQHVVHVVCVFGGFCSMIFSAFFRFKNVIFFAFDSPKELEVRKEFYRLYNVIQVPLAFGHTLQSMAMSLDHPANKSIDSVANANATLGLAAMIAAGDMAGELYVESKDQENILEELRSEIFKLTGGAPQGVYHHSFLNVAGATGSGAAKPVTTSFVSMYETLEIPVEVHYHTGGQIALTGLSERAPLNDPAARLAYIDCVTSPAPARVPHYLHMFDLPPSGPNGKEERDSILQLQFKALFSPELHDYTEMLAPNHASDSKFGNIDALMFEIIQNPKSVPAVKESTARHVRQSLKDAFNNSLAHPSLIQSDEWTDGAIPLDAASVDKILESSWRDSKLLQEQILSPTQSFTPRLAISFRDIGQIDITVLDHYFSKPIDTLTDALKRKRILASLGVHLKRALSGAEHQASQHTALLESSLKSMHGLAKAASEAKVSKRLHYLKHLEIRLIEIRAINEKRVLQRARINAIRSAQATVQAESLILNQKIQTIDHVLSELISVLGPSDSRQLVITQTLDIAMSTLIEMPKYSAAIQDSIINRMAACLTRQGLQLVVNAESPTIESLAHAIVFGPSTFKSPPLGAKAYFQKSQTLYYIPPVDPHDKRSLVDEIVRLDKHAIVFFGDDIDCGPAVVKFKFRRFDNVESMLPGFLKHDLARAIGSELPMLRFPNGLHILDKLGIRYDGDSGKIDFGRFPHQL